MRTRPIRNKKTCRLTLEELESRLAPSVRPDHVVLVMMENHNYNEIIGVSSAPYINNTLAAQGALMTNSFAIEHPSEPNYLDIFSGSNQGVIDDTFPAPGSPYTTPDLGGELIKAGFTFGGYSEDMPSVGYTGDGPYGYAGKHNPMVDFADVPAADNMPYAGFFPTDFTKLPTFSFVVPNLIDDMHDGTVSQGDTWLKNNVEAYRQWAQTHNSLLIMTFDEDSSGNNQVATIFDGQMVKPGQYNEHLDHFGVLRTIEDMYGLLHAGASATATPISDIFVSQSTHLKMTAPSSAAAGSPFSITVTAQDTNNNTLTSYLGTIHFTSADAAAVLPSNYTFTTADAGVHTFAGITLKTAGSQSITATDTATGSITGNASITVSPAAAKTLVVSGYPSSTTVGAVQSFTVTARDAYGNTATGYTGVVTFSSSDSLALLPANYTFTTANAGVHTFSATLNTLGTQSITVTDTGNALITGTESGITVSSVALGATYYVSLTGSDSNLGTLSQPFATIKHGASLLKPGDTLYIRAGTYAEQLVDAIPGGTSWTSPVTVAAYPGEIVILRPTSSSAEGILYFAATGEKYIIVKGITIDATNASADAVKITWSSTAGASNHIRLLNDEIENTPNGMGVLVTGDPGSGNNVDYNEFINCQVHNNGSNSLEHGIYISTNHNLIEGCNVYNNAAYGIQLYAGDGHNSLLVQNNIVRNNRVHDNNTAAGYSGGIVVATGDNNLVYNNLVYNNTRALMGGIQLYPGVNATSVLNNTIYNNGYFGIYNQSGATNSVIQNNIVYNNASGDINNSGTGATIDHNTSNSQNPMFVNAATFDFHLQAGSPAINAGITLPQVPVDFDGLKRPQGPAYSIGAYEFPVDSAVATHLQIVAPSISTAGSAFSLTVTAQDANSSTVTSYLGTVHFTSSDGAAALPGNYTFTAADAGVHTFAGVVFKTAGGQSITAADTMNGSITANASVTVNAAAAATFVVSGYPSSTTAGTSHNFTVTAHDAYGNLATGYSGTVTFSSTDSQAVLSANYTFTSSDAGLHTFTATLKTAGTQSITAKDTVTASISGTQSGITVNAAATSHLQIGAPANATAGSSFTLTVTAQDVNNNTLTNYSGTVHFTSSDGAAILPGNYTFTTADAGVHTFTGVILKTAGGQSVTITDTVTGSFTGNALVTVNPAAASTLVVAGYASPITAGTSHNFTVAAHDAYGNTATSYTGMLTFGSNDGKAVLPANYTFTGADAGVHSFSATLKTAGSQSITATDTVTSSVKGSQSGITVNPAAANMLMVTGYPSSTTAGVSHGFTVTAQDAFGNTASAYAATAVFTSSDRQAGLPANYTFTAADAGMHAFSATLKTAGSQSITATDTVTSSIKGSQSGITVTPAAASTLVLSGYPSSTTPGTAQSFIVTAQDAFRNTATGYSGTIAFTSTDSHASLPANYTFTPTDAGVHTFTATFNTTGTQSITATDTVNALITGSQAGITVSSIAGTIYYVSPTGSDNNPGTLSQPFATINHGGRVLKPGDTLYIRAGTYAESLVDAIPGGTSWTSPVTVAAYPGETVILRPASSSGDGVLFFAATSEKYIIVKGLIIDATNDGVDAAVKITWSSTLGASSHIRLQNDEIENNPKGPGILITGDPSTGNNVDYNELINCKIHNNGSDSLGHGIYISTNHNLIDGCNVYNNAGYGIQLYASDGHDSLSVQSNVIRNCKVHDNCTAPGYSGGIVIATGDNNLVYNNLVYNNTLALMGGIQLYPGVNASSVWNNTIYNNGYFGIYNQPGATNSVIQNNIIYNNASGDINNSGTGATIDHNTSNSQNPLFVNPTANDFHLRAGSPAIYAGITLPQVPVDLDGLKRPQGPAYSIGAYEYPVTATHLQIVVPSNATAGVAFSMTITALDPYGDTATSYIGTVHFTSSDKKAVLPSDYAFTKADGGVHVFAGAALVTAGSQTVTATDKVTATITGKSSVITVSPAALNHLKVTAPASSTAGLAFSITVTAQDAFNNTVTGYSGTIHFTSSDGQAILPANYTFISTDKGGHTFSNGVALKTAGSQVVTANDTGNASVKGSASIGVKPGLASKLSINAPASVTPGVAFTFTVTALDAYGNVATGYIGTVQFSSSDATASLPVNYTFTSSDAGIATFTAIMDTTGSEWLTATDTLTPGITGTDLNIQVG